MGAGASSDEVTGTRIDELAVGGERVQAQTEGAVLGRIRAILGARRPSADGIRSFENLGGYGR